MATQSPQLVLHTPIVWEITHAAARYPQILNQPNSARQPHLRAPLSPQSLDGPFYRPTEDTSLFDREPVDRLDSTAVAKGRSYL